MFEIEFPLVAFSHCRDVVVAVSKAGGMGVLGAVGHTPEMLEQDLKWIDEHIDGKPYGVDILVPTTFEGKGSSVSSEDLINMIPQEYRDLELMFLNNMMLMVNLKKSFRSQKKLKWIQILDLEKILKRRSKKIIRSCFFSSH
jgi:NAD(P)H-dependent flavin oxidoreductase YrpB (nitropropane dioxygenase family)